MDFKQYNRLTGSQIPPTNNNYSVQRKILVEEIFEDLQSKTTFIRKLNCQEIYDYQKEKVSIHLLENASQVNNGKTRDCAVRSTTFQTILPNHGTITNFKNYKSDDRVSCITTTNIDDETPMEIDSSSDRLIINPYDFTKINYDSDNMISNKTLFRKRKSGYNKITSLISKDNAACSKLVSINQPLISRFSKVLFLIGVLLMLIVVYIIISGDHFIYVNKNIQLENIKKDLQKYVVHQENAIERVIENFEKSDSWRGIKVLPFIGSTGVGKTFTVNIIKKHFLPQLVHEIDINQLINSKQQNIIANLNNCCCNLIIIDNLRAANFNDFLNFVNTLPKSFVLLVIPIFNIQDTVDGVIYTVQADDFKLIRDELENSKLHYELVLFDMLTSNMIEKWLRKELQKRQISENRHDSLVKFLLDNNHVKYKGFKGLNSQLLLALDNK